MTPGPNRVPGAAVHCRRVTHLYRRDDEQVVALRDVDLDLEPGERLALLGPSGSGKSTLLSLLAGLQGPTTGEVSVAGRSLAGADRRAGRTLRAGVVGLLLQEPGRALLPYARPTQLLAAAGDRDPSDTLARFGLGSTARQDVSTLSAGQQQRLALATTMVARPALLLADEPTSRLDARARDGVLAALHQATSESGATVILVTHDPAVAATFPRTLTMRDGRVGSEGRYGREYAIVGPDGTVSLPREAMTLLPPGSRVRVHIGDGAVKFYPVDRLHQES